MIIITGMHRSGTSITANMLYKMDMNFGEPSLLMEPDQWNPRGYYENTEIHILNDQLILGDVSVIREFRMTPPEKRRILTRLIMTVFRARYSLPGGPKRIAKRADRRQDEIKRVADAYKGVAVKDPRFSITVGEWAKYVGIDRVLYCYRHPHEVALSLRSRYRLPLWLGYHLWKVHVTQFFAQAKGLPIIMIHYGDYFGAAPLEEIKRLYQYANRPYNEAEARAILDDVLVPELHRNIYAQQAMPADIASLYAQLMEMHEVYSQVKPFASDLSLVRVAPASLLP